MPPKAKKPKKQDSKSSLDTNKKQKTKTEDDPGIAPAPLTRQSSNDYGEWYHTVPDEDVWGGEDPDDPWGDKDKEKSSSKPPKAEKGKRAKETKDEEEDDAGFEVADGGDWGDPEEKEKEKEDSEEEEDTGPAKTPYRILDSKNLTKRRKKVIEENAEMLGLSNEEMDLLLRYLRYDKKKIELFLGDTKNQEDVRLQSGIQKRKYKPVTAKTVQCALWCSIVPVEEAFCLSLCGHYVCNDCWKGFLESEINAGVNSVFSKCPAQDEKGNKCQCPIDYKTMKKYLTKPLLEKLDHWILDQFVSSSKNVKWCPKAGCGQAVEYDGGDAVDVTCKCTSSFCFHCGGPAHSPAPCDLVKKWMTINDDGEAASERLIQSLTKPCPKCGTRIEKNRHCNHMKCSKCNFDFCWQCMQAITLGTQHPSWYVCKNREQAASEGKLDTAEEERLNLNKFLSKLSMHKQHVEDCRKDQKSAIALIPKIRDREGTLPESGRTLNWLSKIVEKIQEAQRFLEWTWVYSYFMADSARKETFINWQKVLEEKADGMLHDLEKALGDKDSFPKFLGETKRITEIKKSVEVLTSKMQQMQELADEIASALQHEADTKTSTWSCIRCSKEFGDKDKDGKRVTHCGACSACRDHGDFDCLVLGCKKG